MLISGYFQKEDLAAIEDFAEQIFKLLSKMIDNTN